MKNRVYLDHNATAPLKPAAKAAVIEALEHHGNASSVHKSGREAKARIERAREQIARALNVKPGMVIFTSGATESNNMILHALPGYRILAASTEHPSILKGAKAVEIIPVGRDGLLDMAAFEDMLKKDDRPALVSVMLVNNETGVIQPIRQIADIARKYNALIHTDAVQALGKIPVSARELGVDFISLSSHKIGGPQGMGALVAYTCMDMQPFMTGGKQEENRRAGTPNLAGVVGFGAAADCAAADLEKYQGLKMWRDKIEAHIKSAAPHAVVFGEAAPRVANTTMVSLPGINSETQMIALDLADVAVSSGSACSSGTVTPSHVLKAMGASDAEATSCIRISLGWDTTEEDVELFLKAWDVMYGRVKSRMAV